MNLVLACGPTFGGDATILIGLLLLGAALIIGVPIAASWFVGKHLGRPAGVLFATGIFVLPVVLALLR